MPYKDPVKSKLASSRHYEANKPAYIARAKAHNKASREAAREFVVNYLRNNPCVDCGEDDIVVLEFDHRDPAAKEFAIGYAIRSHSFGLKRIIKEIGKCDVRCANCHRRKTAMERGFFRHLISV